MNNSETGKMCLKVFVRLRPTSRNAPSLVHADHRVLYIKDPLRGHSSEFVFDKVFDGETKQDAVFQEVGMPLVDHVMRGYNACCLAYGHTGSGKTYSMYGRESMSVLTGSGQPEGSDLGIMPRACELITKAVSQVNRKADHMEANGSTNVTRIKLFVSFMEIYMEKVRDLGAAAQAHIRANAARTGLYDGPTAGAGLAAFTSADGGAPTRTAAAALRDPNDYFRTNLDVMEDASGMTFVKDLTYIEVCTAEDMVALLQAGYGVRANCPVDQSSRSHTIFTISVVTYRGDQQPVTGRLNLVDLAGSEKQSRSGPEGQRLREASAINKSLTALCKVVVAMSQAPPAAAPAPAPAPASHRSSSSTSSPASASSASTASAGSAPVLAHAPAPPMGMGTPPSHVPFRDSKLTRVLKDSFLGNSMTCLLGCVYPVFDEVDESLASLQFATKCQGSNPAAPHVNVIASAAAAGLDGGLVEDLMNQIAQLKDELEVTHAHYQKLIESIAGPSWRHDPGPVERAPGNNDLSGKAAAGLNAFAAALSTLGKGSGTGGGGGGGGGGGFAGTGGAVRRSSMGGGGGSGEDRWRISAVGDGIRGGRTQGSDVTRAPGGGSGGVAKSVAGGPPAAATAPPNASARISLLEAQIRKLESQLSQARISAQQYEERLSARKEEMDLARERMAGKEHAQFAEIKKLRAQVSELTKALDAERTESIHKLEDARRRSDEEASRLMRDVDTLRTQLAQVTGTVGSLVERHSAAISAEKRQREAVKMQATQLLQQQYNRGTEELRAQLENVKQQSAYFLGRRAEEVAELKQQLDAARAAHAAEKDALLAELDYLASYSERVTELVRRMESGVVPVHERGNGVKAFRLPQRDRPPRLEGARLAVLKERNTELHERLTALSAAANVGASVSNSAHHSLNGGLSSASLNGGVASGGSGTAAAPGGSGSGPVLGSWVGSHSQNSPSRRPLGSSVDLDALRAQVEAELKAQVTAQVVGDLSSNKTVEYIRELETAVARYRNELQAEKKRSGEVLVALRSVQRQHARPDSPINKALATHTPAGTIKMAPTWGMGHNSPRGLSVGSRPATAGLTSLSGERSASGAVSAPASARRPNTSMAALTSSFRENGVAIP